MQAHVTLLAPFTPPEQLDPERIREAHDAVARFRSFAFRLPRTAYLDLGSRRVLYLAPEPPEPFVELINALVSRFPEHPPYGDPGVRPRPHVTVATSPDDVLLAQIEEAVRRELPISAVAAEAWVVEYGEDGRHVRSRMSFRR